MQVSSQPRLPEVLWSDQATSAVARFHHMPVDGAICTAIVSRDHNTFSWPEKSLDQFSISSGVVKGDNATSMVFADDALLGLTANHRVTANDYPYSPAPSSQWYQSYCDQQSFVPYSQQPAHFVSSTANSVQWYEGTRPKTSCPAIPNSNGTPAHVAGNVLKSPGTNGIEPWFLARHSQDDYLKNPEKVATDLNARIVDVKNCMREPFPGYDARPLLPDHRYDARPLLPDHKYDARPLLPDHRYDARPLLPDHSVVNGGLPAHNWADPPHRHVTVDADYCGLPLAPADSQTQQSGSPEYSASSRQQAAALSNHPTGADQDFLTAHSGSDYSSYSPSEKSEEFVRKTDISTNVPAEPEQPIDETASGSSSPDVSLSSTEIFESDSDSYDSLEDLEQRVAEACAIVEKVLRDRDAHEEFEANIRRIESEIRANRKREQEAREEEELEHTKSWPAQQNAVTMNLWLCDHYQRRCWVKFECCDVFYACHRCHNYANKCSNEKAKASEATHYKCNECKHEEKIDENSQQCSSCGTRMAAYFCAFCKHFTSTSKDPYHCEKCGICRIHKDKSFHCDVCNICLDKRLQNRHKCRPNSGHEKCSICLEDAFSGCQILPCSHKVHRECAVAMIQSGIRKCPVCRHPLYSPSPYRD